MAAYKLAALQKALDESVPSSELEKANKQYTELTVKYRDMLQRDGRLIQRTNNLEHLEVCFIDPFFSLNWYMLYQLVVFFLITQTENDSLREQISTISKELEITKEKLNTFEHAWDNITAAGIDFNHFHI